MLDSAVEIFLQLFFIEASRHVPYWQAECFNRQCNEETLASIVGYRPLAINQTFPRLFVKYLFYVRKL